MWKLPPFWETHRFHHIVLQNVYEVLTNFRMHKKKRNGSKAKKSEEKSTLRKTNNFDF